MIFALCYAPYSYYLNNKCQKDIGLIVKYDKKTGRYTGLAGALINGRLFDQ